MTNKLEMHSTPDLAAGYISATALAVGVSRQMLEHIVFNQPMPTVLELEYLAARDILRARGLGEVAMPILVLGNLL